LLVSAVSLSSESLNSIYTMTLWKAENLIRVSLADSRGGVHNCLYDNEENK
jgi:hypothetical protein